MYYLCNMFIYGEWCLIMCAFKCVGVIYECVVIIYVCVCVIVVGRLYVCD